MISILEKNWDFLLLLSPYFGPRWMTTQRRWKSDFAPIKRLLCVRNVELCELIRMINHCVEGEEKVSVRRAHNKLRNHFLISQQSEGNIFHTLTRLAMKSDADENLLSGVNNNEKCKFFREATRGKKNSSAARGGKIMWKKRFKTFSHSMSRKRYRIHKHNSYLRAVDFL
jgi:hypothetical protein